MPKKNETVWSVGTLHKKIRKRKPWTWCMKAVEAIKAGAYTKEDIIAFAYNRSSRAKIVFFVGKPTKEYPKGRPYTPEIIINELSKKGLELKRESARKRIERVLAGKSDEKILFQEPKDIGRRGPKKSKTTIAGIQDLPEDRWKTYEEVKAWNEGKLTQNQLIGC
jgi:hypothetical protein